MPFGNAVSYTAIPHERRLPMSLSAVIIRYKKRDYVKKYFTYIGNKKDTYSYPTGDFYDSSCYWSEIEECICAFLPSWSEYDYSVNNGEINIFKK